MPQKHSILIVDDERSYLDILVSILQTDYRVIVSKTGEEALQRVASGPLPDLILLDVAMPGIDGYETCRRLKLDAATRDIPVVFLTAKDDVDAEAHGLNLGAVDYITKPISAATVRARIRTHLALRQARKELTDQNERLEQRVRERTQKLRRMSADMAVTEERERRRLAQELHDGPIQRLALSKIQLGRLRAATDPAQHRAFDDLNQTIDTAVGEMRTLLIQLSPPILYELGLAPALEWLAESVMKPQGIVCEVKTDGGDAGLSEEINVFLFQAIRELMINIVKHAGARHAQVELRSEPAELVVAVSDDGAGFDAEHMFEQSKSGGFGLFSVRERLSMLGGTLAVQSKGGAVVTLSIPVEDTEQSG